MEKKTPPDNGDDILMFWKRIFELFRGLTTIHCAEPEDEDIKRWG